MAKFVLDNASFIVGGTTLTTYTRTVTINFTAAEQDKTVMGNSAMARLSGLKDASIDVEFLSDFADNLLDEQMFAWYNGGTEVICKVSPEGSTAATTNPVYTGTFIVTAFTPISGTVGDAAAATANFMLATGTMVERNITP